jgi:cytochrome c
MNSISGDVMLVRTLSVVLLGFAGVACAADVAAGRNYFREVCTQCHSAEPTDGGGEQGPILLTLFGRAAATGDATFPYTQALKDSKLVWNAATLDRFLTDPMKVVPGTAMPIPVLAQKDRDNLIAYFQSLTSPGNTR